MFEKKPNLRRPIKSAYRQTQWSSAFEVIFVAVAKGAMAIAVLIALAPAILSGDVGGGFPSRPTTKTGRLRSLMCLIFAIAIVGSLMCLIYLHRAS